MGEDGEWLLFAVNTLVIVAQEELAPILIWLNKPNEAMLSFSASAHKIGVLLTLSEMELKPNAAPTMSVDI